MDSCDCIFTYSQMNYNQENTRTDFNSPFHLDEEFGNITLQNEPTFEYEEVDEDRILYCAPHELLPENFDYTEANAIGLDAACSSVGSWVGWECSPEVKDAVIDILGPEEVRWFYKGESDKRWIEFSGYDSLRIEFKYRQLYHECNLLNNTFQTQESPPHAYFENTLSDQLSALNVRSDQTIDSSASGFQYSEASPAYSSELEHHSIVVRGGMYEVDLKTWKCDSIYWPGEECIITRGLWFYGGSWQPLEAERSEALETIHLQLFYGHRHSDYQTDSSNKTQKTVLHRETFPEFYVEWYSPTEMYLYSEAAPSKLVRTFTQKLGFQKSTGYRLYRGYRSHATETDRPVDINHLVFVIHGIGQKMDTGRIIRNTSAFRGCVEWLKKKFFPSSDLRVEFFPVEWRSSLKLDGDIVEAITPHKLVGLRQLLNSSAMDIMYYTSPVYGTEIQRGLSEELNKLYSKFTQRNPYFISNGGKVSVIAHSLGCVIVYDIVTGWHPGSWQMAATCAPRDKQNQPLQSTRSSNYSYSLNFQIENLFCIGSPLSVFLALRLQDLQAAGRSENILPPNLCKYFYNIFYPSDPVAYRMEPLIMREYSRIAPLQIHAYNATTLLSYSDMPPEPVIPDTSPGVNIANPSIALMKRREVVDDIDSDSPSSTPSKERSWSIWGLMRGKGKAAESAGSPPQCDSLPPGLDHRLDYVLRETNIGGSYLSALTSHTAYWSNYDVAHFVLTRIFPTLEAQRIQQLSSTSQQAQSTPASGSPDVCK